MRVYLKKLWKFDEKVCGYAEELVLQIYSQ